MEVFVPLLLLVSVAIGVGAQDSYSSGTWGQQQPYNGGGGFVPQPQPQPQPQDNPYSSGNQMGFNGGMPSVATNVPFSVPSLPSDSGPEPLPSPDPEPPLPFEPEPPLPPDSGPEPQPPPDSGPEPTPSDDCPPGELPKMIQTQGRVVPVDGKEIPGVSEEDCAQACMGNTTPDDGSPLKCSLYIFIAQLGSCMILSEPVPEDLEEIEAEGSYGKKACYPADLVAPCPGPFEVQPQQLFDDLENGDMLDATSLEECTQACLDTSCASGTYFTEEKAANCLLSKDSHETKPDLFLPADLEKATYFTSGCPTTAAKKRLRARTLFRLKFFRARHRARRLRLKRIHRVKLLKSTPIRKPFDTKWTLWSRCINGKQYKYRRCQNRDIRKCLKVMRKCSGNERESNLKAVEETSRIQTIRRRKAKSQRRERLRTRGPECLAIVERGTGRKRCDFGGFRFINGRRRFCRKPIDCP